MEKIFQNKNLNTNGVNRKSIEQLSNYLTNAHLPFAQTLRFKWNKEVMQVNYQLRYGHKNSATITSPASFELIQTLITVLATNSPDALLDYLKSDDLGEVILNDERLDLFYQFLESDSKGEIRPDWIDDNGTRYACVSFQLAKMRSVDFCLPKNIAVQGALKNMGCPFDKEALTLSITNN
ncbi:hypothetical protein HMPREF0650_0659 [Hoylesella buccalis ATCC 35310]|uniref:Uncharacterized protein n=2 Tax=Hoylesella buccalis TaxID=28127 RepID=D1W827_9BACT|nr:hypothetical protein HMPREF0650_0659 [Hoylesella buccalis ATCC 35310]